MLLKGTKSIFGFAHHIQYLEYSLFLFLQPFKNVKTILSSGAYKTTCCLLTPKEWW